MQIPLSKPGNTYHFIQGKDRMSKLTRSFDWASHSLGTADRWPSALRTAIGIVMHSSFPMCLYWGTDFLCFYNEAFCNEVEHIVPPDKVGRTGADLWGDHWTEMRKLLEPVLNTGEAVLVEDQVIPAISESKNDERYWSCSYSPVYGDNGQVAGVISSCSNTTLKVQNARRLAGSERRFQTLMRDGTIGIAVLIGDDNIVDTVNDTFAKMLDQTVADLTGKPLFDVVPATESYFSDIIDAVKRTARPYYLYDHPYFVWPANSMRDGFVNIVYQPFIDENESVRGVMLLCQDVTEQVVARKKVEEGELRLRSFVDSAPFPIGVYMGKEMKIALANQAIIDVWGKGKDVIGKRYADVLPELADQDIFSSLHNVFTTGIPFHARNQLISLEVDGKMKSSYFNYSFTPLFDMNGEVYGVMNTAADVTDLHLAKQKVEQSEQNFRSMVLQAPVAMCILKGPAFVVEVVNELMIEIWGKPLRTVIGKPIFEALPDAREQGLEKMMLDVYHTGQSITAHERPIALLRKGKLEIVYQNFVYQPYRETDGSIAGILAISIDVTYQVLARQTIEEIVTNRTAELATANNKLRESNAELAQFAYIASHDLQEPARKVNTFAQMLENSLGKVDDRSNNYLEKIKNSSERMLSLVRDVLGYSQLARENLSFRSVDLQQIVETVCTDFELLIEQKNARVICGELPIIEAIPLQMIQLFGNLVSNALKFSVAERPPEIFISSSIISNEEAQKIPSYSVHSTYYRIEVKDNGIGFNQESADQIFNIFQRLHGKSEYEGTGIGLALCKKIMQNHHGDIFAQSEPGQGSKFILIIPGHQWNSEGEGSDK